MLNQYDEIITIDELCEILMIGKNLAYRLLTEKKIKAFRIGKKWKIPKTSVEQFIIESTHYQHTICSTPSAKTSSPHTSSQNSL